MRTLFVATLSLSVMVMAQDRSDTLRQRDVAPTELRVTFAPDGGCDVTAIAVGTTQRGERRVGQSEPAAYNGARCATLRAGAQKLGEWALGVGDGGLP